MSLQSRISDLTTRIATEFKSIKNIVSGNTSGSLSGLTTNVKTSILAAINELVTSISGKQNNLGYTPENVANKGAANGYASLDGNAKIPANQLPGFVDDIIEGVLTNPTTFTANATPQNAAGVVVPATGVIYVDVNTNLQYRWGGSAYITTSASLALGETPSTAFRGDRGKSAYDHSQITDGSNPHGTTFSNLAGKPTTVSGYGITDAFTKTEIGDVTKDFVAEFEANIL